MLGRQITWSLFPLSSSRGLQSPPYVHTQASLLTRTDTSPVLLAAFWMLGTLTSLLALAIAARELSDTISTMQMITVRNAVSLLILCVLLQAGGWHQLKTGQPYVHLVRAVSHLVAQYAWIFGIAAIPITEVFALEFTGPVWTVVIASVLLGEKINRFRILTLAMGVIGVLVILRPGFRDPDPVMFIVIFSALCFALANVLTKKLVAGNSPLNIIFYVCIIQFLLTVIPTTFVWVTPGATEWFWMAVMGVVSITAHYSFARAFAYADAMVVIPMDFLRLPLAAILAWILYSEGLDLFVLAGALIMFSGNFINILAEKKLLAKNAVK
jgi:drug/metabolite transporter (DMT)-like permease